MPASNAIRLIAALASCPASICKLALTIEALNPESLSFFARVFRSTSYSGLAIIIGF